MRGRLEWVLPAFILVTVFAWPHGRWSIAGGVIAGALIMGILMGRWVAELKGYIDIIAESNRAQEEALVKWREAWEARDEQDAAVKQIARVFTRKPQG